MSKATRTKTKTRHLQKAKSGTVRIPGDPEAKRGLASDESQVIIGSGNIFADLGLPNPDELQVKSAIANRIEDLIEAAGCTQADAALRMGISQPDVSNIVRGRLKGYTLDRLVECLLDMGQEVEVRMPRNRVSNGRGNIVVSYADAAAD
jgi:predicted XRE-type DNA-binding protein